MKQYGADILRLWVAQIDYTVDQRIGPEILKTTADSYRRLRNTLRYLLGALDGFDEAERVEPAEMPELERWILHRLTELDDEVRKGYAAYDFQRVFQTLFQFATVDLSAFYFDIRKDALYCDARREPAPPRRPHRPRRPLRTASSPGSPRCSPSPWRRSGSPASPATTARSTSQDFPATPRDWHDPRLAAKWDEIRRVRRVVTGALEVERRDKRIGASLEAAPAVHVADAALRAALASVDFADVCITSDLALSAAPAPAGAFTLDDVPGVAVVPRLAEGAKVRPLLEGPPRRRHPRPPGRLRPLRRGARLTTAGRSPRASLVHGLCMPCA